MNQCRPCHSTCYTCDGFTNTSCISCTGDLYLNPNIRACIPNCEFYALTTSLTIPNMCVLFDADAVLVNVDVDDLLNPSNFTRIEAAITKSTAQGYTVLWKLDFNETMRLNNNTVTLDPSGPFSGNPPKTNLNAGLKPSFFEAGKKYNFILDIIKTNGDFFVSVSKNWTLTMNSPPLGGELIVTPDSGYRKTTKFLMTCDGWTSNIDFPLSYRFYSREINTNVSSIIQDWRNITYSMSSFDVRFYQIENSTIQITCEARDGYDMISKSSKNITIVNTPTSDKYNLTQALEKYKFKEASQMDDTEIMQRSEYLKSLGEDIYKDVKTEKVRTEVTNSLDFSKFEVFEPSCINNFCNFRGECSTKIDIYIGCTCDIGYVGERCQLDKEGYPKLASSYQNLFNVVIFKVSEKVTDNILKSVHNLIKGASFFFEDPSFFTNNLQVWIDLVKANFRDSIIKNTTQYIDMYDFVFYHTRERMIQAKMKNKKSLGFPLRNITLLTDQKAEFEAAISKNRENLESLLNFIVEQLGVKNQPIKYDSTNFYIGASLITPTFNDTAFFLDRIDKYQSYPSFMKCLNYIQITRLNNPFYNVWMIFIEYKDYPLAYDLSFYQNSITPFTTLYFIDAVTNRKIIIEGCDNDPITIFKPFNSVQYVEQVNNQLSLFLPNNYFGPDHPIFKSPIFINETGFVSDDTVEERIEKFQRTYNFTCKYWDKSAKGFVDKGMNYSELDPKNYLRCNTTHTTDFNAFIIPNSVTYNIDNRFFYLKYPQVFAYLPNYKNYAFFIAMALIALYLIAVIVTSCWDWKEYRQEVLLEFLKYNIVKVQLPYNQKINFNPNEIFNAEEYFEDENKNNKGGVNYEERFGKDEDPVESVFKPEFGKELGKNVIDNRKKINNNDANNLNFGLDDKKNDGDKLNLFDDNIFNLDDNLEIGEGKNQTSNRYTTTNNPFIASTDKGLNEKEKIAVGEFNVDHLNAKSKEEMDMMDDEEKEYEKRLENFASLSLSLCEFFCWNVKARHVLISPLINPSIFNARYKKLTCLICQLSLQMILLSVFLTINYTIIVSFNTKPIVIQNIGGLLIYTVLSALIANIFMYLLVWPFRMSTDQRKLLFNTVKQGNQMRILKTWGEIDSSNTKYMLAGMLINLLFTIGGFYFSFNFACVWTAWGFTFLIAFIVSIFFDLVIFEFGFELIIAIIYSFRVGSPTSCKLAEWLNRVRSYRTMFP